MWKRLLATFGERLAYMMLPWAAGLAAAYIQRRVTRYMDARKRAP